MRQRSIHEAPVDIPEIPATVGPGEVVDWPHPIAGFVEVVKDAPAPQPDELAKSPRKTAAPAPAPADKEPTQ